MSKDAIIIFTRIPVPGKTKTRLMPCYTALECTRLHVCFLKDILNECKKIKKDIFVFYAPDGNLKVLEKILGEQCTYCAQIEGGIGERMESAVEVVFRKGYEKCVLIGADIPEIKTRQLEQSYKQLEHTDIVMGLTKDGGYYLIGAKQPIPEAFSGIDYNQKKVALGTKEKLESFGKSVSFVETLSDIDTSKDLLDYRKKNHKNVTGRYLEKYPKISVIIPIYNEESTICKLQVELKKLNDCEIIFVDGGSIDKTLSLIDKKYRVITSLKGRANQMNAGARASGGQILFFLHCDSQLPKYPVCEIRNVMKNYNWGCFGIAFESYSIELLICRLVSNSRIKDRKVVFGDQGIFVNRDLFFEVGGYPQLPIMEDYQFSLTLKQKKEKIGMTQHRIITSPRRFEGSLRNRLSVMWKMNRLRSMYRQGVDIHKISDLYKDIR